MSLRILVLTSSTGSGHDMRARAFSSWVNSMYGDRVEVRIERIIENGSLLGRFGVWLYNTIHKYAPFLHNLYFFIVELFVSSHGRSVSFGGRYYRRLLADYQPQIVLSVHDSTNRGYFEDARRVLGREVRCVTYCGEFSGGYGYSRNWVNPSADHFIARTEPARDFAVQLGIPRERTSVFQKVLPPGAFTNPMTDDERSDLLRRLGLHPDRFTLFLATGGYGANHHFSFLNAILPLADRIQVILVCGRNQRIFEKLTRWSARHPQLAAYIEGYSTRMAEFFQVSHAVVTRGGANSTMEALHFGCPLLYNSLGGLMPQEQCTVRYFLQNEAARSIRKPADLAEVLTEWSRLDNTYEAVLRRLRSLQRKENPRDLVRKVLGSLSPSEEIP